MAIIEPSGKTPTPRPDADRDRDGGHGAAPSPRAPIGTSSDGGASTVDPARGPAHSVGGPEGDVAHLAPRPAHDGRPHVVVVGGGFAGLELTKRLRKLDAHVTLVDQHNYHTFQPLLYQVGTGGMEADSIAYPLRKVFRKDKNVHIRLACVERIDTTRKVLETTLHDIHYDHLVIATGSTTNFYNFEPIKDKLLTLKTVPDALNIRSFVLQNFEKAVAERNPAYFEELTNIAIVGGGATGIELAGSLGEMRRYILPLDYPELDLQAMRIVLFQSGPVLLAGMSEYASAKALEYLTELGVEVRLNDRVTEYDGDVLRTKAGFEMRTDTMVWTAGVKANIPAGLPAGAVETGRIEVDAYNRVIGCESVYAVGDVCAMITEELPRGHPMLAPVAQQQGQHLAKNLRALLAGQELAPFAYFDKGTMATVGRNRAVVDLPFYSFGGFFAWVTWMLVHVVLLVGFRNKFAAMTDWTINYFTFDSPMRLIIRTFRPEGVGTSQSVRGAHDPG